jgi:serine/threonine protein kinase
MKNVFRRHYPPIVVGDYLGSGGFSDVFAAASDYDGVKDFVIKILRPELLGSRKGSQRDAWAEEMRIKDIKKRFTTESYVQWALCQHLSDRVSQTVVRVFDHGEFDAKHRFQFILMERMGATLRDLVSDPKHAVMDKETLRRKAHIMAQMAQLIFNVHQEGIIHRDIKPENVFFTRDFPIEGTDPPRESQLKLGDFGTVRWVRTYSKKYDGVIIGTQWYLSPEQIMNPGQIDTRTDIYSFGVVCYELLYGSHPKNVKTGTRNILEKLAWAQPEPRTPPHGCEALHDVIFRCLNEPATRYQSMAEVVRDLRGFVKKWA